MTTLSAISPLPALAAETKPRSPLQLAWRRFSRNRLAMVGTVVLLLLLAACFGSLPWTLAPHIDPGVPVERSPRQYAYQDGQALKQPPSASHIMGTDANGRDLAARFLLGGVFSLSIGIASALIAIVAGTAVGTLAGYTGGRTDAVLMRIVDLLYGLPSILLVILLRVGAVPNISKALLAIFPRENAAGQLLHARGFTVETAGQTANIAVLLVGIGAVSWLTLARVVRGQVMSLREQPYVEAASALGFSKTRILTRHILPNLIGTIIVYGTLTVPTAILTESFLSFLGLGIVDPLPSWGKLASEGMDALNPVHVRWWLIAWPCAGLSIALLCLNFVGDGIRDAMDPRAN